MAKKSSTSATSPKIMYMALNCIKNKKKKNANSKKSINSHTLTFLVDGQIRSHFPGAKRKPKMSADLQKIQTK